MKKTLDARDMGKEPGFDPDDMDPKSILRNRERVRRYLVDGSFTWPQHGGDLKRGDWVQA